MRPIPSPAPCFSPRRFTAEEAERYLESLGIPAHGAHIERHPNGKYWKYRVRWGSKTKSLSRENLEGVLAAFHALDKELDTLFSEMPTDVRRRQGLQTCDSVRRARAAKESQPPPPK